METARVAIQLARVYEATLALDDCNAGSSLSLAMKSAGLLSGTLGELRACLSQVVLFDIDPEADMPRFWDFLSAEHKNSAFRIDTHNPSEAVQHLRLALRQGGQAQGEPWLSLTKKIATTSSGAILFGEAWLQDGAPLITELLLWLKELNRAAHWYGFPILPEPNHVGLVETLLSETGYPGNIRFSRGQAEFAPCELQIERLIRQEMNDVVVLVGNPGALDPTCLARLAQMKGRSIQISPDLPAGRRDLWFPSARPGREVAGEMLRLDAVPVHLQPVVPSERPTAAQVLAGLIGEAVA